MHDAHALPDAGWYDDPIGDAAAVRWWNGSAWTTVTAPRAALDAPVAAPARVTVAPAATPSGAHGRTDAYAAHRDAGGAVGQVVAPWEHATAPTPTYAYADASPSPVEQLFDTELVTPQYALKRVKRDGVATWREAGWATHAGLADLVRSHAPGWDPVGARHDLHASPVEDIWRPRWLDEPAVGHAPAGPVAGGGAATVRNAWADLPRLQPDWFWFVAVALYAAVGVAAAGIVGYGPLSGPLADMLR